MLKLPNFQNEKENEEKSEQNFALALFSTLISCPQGDSNSQGNYTNGFWDRNVCQFRHAGLRFIKKAKYLALLFLVRMKGLEPPRLAAPDPKSGAAAITPHPQI